MIPVTTVQFTVGALRQAAELAELYARAAQSKPSHDELMAKSLRWRALAAEVELALDSRLAGSGDYMQIG